MYKLSQLQAIDFGRVEVLYSSACYSVHVHIYSSKKMNTTFYPAKQRKAVTMGFMDERTADLYCPTNG
jgi:hypothetical protein